MVCAPLGLGWGRGASRRSQRRAPRAAVWVVHRAGDALRALVGGGCSRSLVGALLRDGSRVPAFLIGMLLGGGSNGSGATFTPVGLFSPWSCPAICIAPGTRRQRRSPMGDSKGPRKPRRKRSPLQRNWIDADALLVARCVLLGRPWRYLRPLRPSILRTSCVT